ncbi:MAG: hypothetical protein NTU61_01100, partial [Candidatus Altiarchaeota archaeon]|nr:hypothetical protein [Candidatus Altiarchaeota archaeon]
PFTLCAVLAQVVPDYNPQKIVKKVSAMGYAEFNEAKLVRRVKLAGEWVKKHGPEYLLFEFLDEVKSREQYGILDDKQRQCLKTLSKELSGSWTPETFHKRIYETARGAGLEPPKLFDAIYLTLIGKRKGPKAASFLLSLDGDFIARRFNSL